MKFSQTKENQRHIPAQIKHKHHSVIPRKKIPLFRTQTQKDPHLSKPNTKESSSD